MANRVPLIVDTSTLYLKELPTGDNLDLTGSGIVGLTGIGGATGNFSGIITATGPVFIGSGTSTGTAGQVLQVSGINSSAYIGGNLGIGTTNPQYKLDVNGNINFYGALYQNGVLFTSGVGIQSGGVVVGSGITTLNFVGAGNTFAVSGTTATISISGSERFTTTVATTSATTIASFVAASFRSAKARIQITQGTSYQVAEVLLIHDGAAVTLVEMASVATGTDLGSFSGTVSGGNVLLRVTMVSATSSTVRVVLDKIEV